MPLKTLSLLQNLPLEIALENLDTREERQEFDVVKDDVEAQLNNEVQLIENIKDKLKVKRINSVTQSRHLYNRPPLVP